jgi:ribonuclease R
MLWWKGHDHNERDLEELESMAQHSSERERAAMLVEREVNALYSCLLMKGRVGETFAATVSSLTDHGFFVELDGLYVEGLVKGETVYPEYEFDQSTYRLSFGNGRVVKVGQKCTVMLLAVNLTKKQMDFGVETFIDEEGLSEASPRHPARERKTGGRHTGRAGGARHEGSRRESPRHEERPARKSFEPPARKAHEASRTDERPARKSFEAPARRDERAVDGPKDEAPFGPPSGKGFDARAVLDRLWRERGGKPLGGESRGRSTDREERRSEDRRGGGRDRNERGGGRRR